MKMNYYNATATQQKQSAPVEHRAVGDHANLLEKSNVKSYHNKTALN
jgi:hypothetical protein